MSDIGLGAEQFLDEEEELKHELSLCEKSNDFLRAQNAELIAALEPFAKRNDEFVFVVGGMATVPFEWLRRAAEAVRKAKG